MGWRDDPVNPEFHSQNKDSKNKSKTDMGGRGRIGSLQIQAEDPRKSLENDPRWSKKELRSSYREVAHTPVDGSTPMHTWSALIGLEGY